MSYYDTDDLRILNSLYGTVQRREHEKMYFKNVDISNMAEVRNRISLEIAKNPQAFSCKKIIEFVCDNIEFKEERLKEIMIKDLYFSYIYWCEKNRYIPKTGWMQ